MKIDDETLIAYVDGELGAAERAAVDAALPGNAELVRRVADYRALRERIAAAFDPVLDEPVPARLLDAVRAAPAPAEVIDLASERTKRRWDWRQWGAMAACLAIGVFAGQFAARPDALIAHDGALVASGELDRALTASIGTEAGTGVRVGLSFVAGSGAYCRTFALVGDASAGLACRRGERWQIEVLARNDTAPATGPYVPAGGALPPAVQRAVDERIQGEALDAAAERAAAARGWRR